MATATTPRPRFRQDLVAEPIDEGGQRFIDVIDPDTGYEYRFYEVEYSLACAMDGERDVAGLLRWAQEELGITPSSSELASVIATLGDLGYLEKGAPGVDVGVGVVVPPTPARPPAADVELGFAGAGAPRPLDAVPQVDDMLLGNAGATERTPVPPAMNPGRDLGPAGPISSRAAPHPSLDVDLSADLPLAASDVKEAVRASKVMKAAELPPDLASALEEPAPPRAVPPVIAQPPRPIAPPVVEPSRPVAPPVVEPPRVAKQPTKPPVELPSAAPRVRPVEPPLDTGGGRPSPVLLVLLVVVLLGAGAFAFYWWYWRPRQNEGETSTKPAPTKPIVGSAKTGSAGGAVVDPGPPPPPPPLSAALEMATPAPIDIQVEVSGTLASIGADGSVVAQGDEIARLGGADKLEDELKDASRDVTRVQGQIDRLTPQRERATGRTAERLDAQLKDRMKSLADKQAKKTAIETALAQLAIVAPAAGTLKTTGTKGQKVAANDVIATIQPQGHPSATFALRPGQTFTVDQEVRLTVKTPPGEPPQTLACKVSETGTRLTVVCPVEDPPPTGTEVLLP
jgi:hypothetical protein